MFVTTLSVILLPECHQVCAKDVSTEAELISLTGETMKYRSAKTGSESRLDVRVLRFWIYGQQAFLDVRVIDPNDSRYVNLSLQQCYKRNEDEKNDITTNVFCK